MVDIHGVLFTRKEKNNFFNSLKNCDSNKKKKKNCDSMEYFNRIKEILFWLISLKFNAEKECQNSLLKCQVYHLILKCYIRKIIFLSKLNMLLSLSENYPSKAKWSLALRFNIEFITGSYKLSYSVIINASVYQSNILFI